MTTREFFQLVLNTCGCIDSPWGEYEQDIVDFCHKSIDALDVYNEDDSITKIEIETCHALTK